MIMDKNLIMSEDQPITATAPSTNDINLGAAGLDIGAGTPIYLNIFLTTPFDTSANTLTITLRHGVASKPDVVLMTVLEAIATSSLLAADVGLLRKVALPNDVLQFVDVNYTVSAGLTSGKITTFLSLD